MTRAGTHPVRPAGCLHPRQARLIDILARDPPVGGGEARLAGRAVDVVEVRLVHQSSVGRDADCGRRAARELGNQAVRGHGLHHAHLHR